jgi:hypothetical protein
MPLVKAIEHGIGQTELAPKWCQDVELRAEVHPEDRIRSLLERSTLEGDSPVGVTIRVSPRYPE